MGDAIASRLDRLLAVRSPLEPSDSRSRRSSVRSAPGRRWQPPEGLTPEDVLAVVNAAATERDRLLLCALWGTGARISEALACGRWTSSVTAWCCQT